ncbi:Six-hairpin glycosidase-like protein [Lasiosphaeria miniovina]|uniref:Six-hairpin glycosidase-like protein n=1 Tax=Lasiosphaeria miniovina TaxID=1954250 RepID=A0AA40B5M0_9PEZI|nr:Six-hairpin glycosidase-like protein [Lasiosphaeria miniovina]KAK0728064.1 Six-hairpin glycosidase-like protein [Lasiosphaeria miniovina]
MKLPRYHTATATATGTSTSTGTSSSSSRSSTTLALALALALILTLASTPCITAAATAEPSHPRGTGPGPDNGALPTPPAFPGPWKRYISTPANKSHVVPSRIWKVRGNVSLPAATGEDGDGEAASVFGRGGGFLVGIGGMLTLAFEQNIGGRLCLEIDGAGGNPTVNLAYSESPWFAGRIPDATTDQQERDLPLSLHVGDTARTTTRCVDPEFVRGGLKFVTVSLPYRSSGWFSGRVVQQVLALFSGTQKAKASAPWVRISMLWVNCTAFPSQSNGRAYSGYFFSSSDVLNRAWYAGAWTLQLTTINPREGSALIDYNRLVDHNTSPVGSWYSNFTIANGSAVTTDGAKRDRVVWPGDMAIAVPGIAVSTYDMAAVRNGLDVLFAHQYPDGSLPYAGPPMGFHAEFSDTYHLHTLLGVFNYVLWSGDVAWLRARWPAYLAALRASAAKVDALGLLHVSSTADWLRPGMTGHNLEASAILYAALAKTQLLAAWLGEAPSDEWPALQRVLENGLARLYCPRTGLFSDNVGRRGCAGDDHVDPQDGNSWVLISGIDLAPSGRPWEHPKSPRRGSKMLPGGPPTRANISANLRKRCPSRLAHGAPAVEFPNVISPFISGFELLGHGAAGQVSMAVELVLLEWAHLLGGDGFTGSTLAEGFRVDGHPQYPAYWSTARNSHAHGWSAGPTAALHRFVLGFELLEPAGRRGRANPQLTPWPVFPSAPTHIHTSHFNQSQNHS